MFTYNLSIFLTSTAFVSTKAKYGIFRKRYAGFFAFVVTNAVLVKKIDKL